MNCFQEKSVLMEEIRIGQEKIRDKAVVSPVLASARSPGQLQSEPPTQSGGARPLTPASVSYWLQVAAPHGQA